MGHHLTFYSVDIATITAPVVSESGIGKTVDYDEVFSEDAVDPKFIASWANKQNLVKLMNIVGICPIDGIDPWFITKEDIPLIISEINKSDDLNDHWMGYKELALLLSGIHRTFNFNEYYLLFTAG